MQQLALVNDLFAAFEDGGKRCTIRKGRRDIALGPLEFVSPDGTLKQIVNVTRVIYTRADGLEDHELWDDGFDSLPDMLEGMKRYYPDITEDTEITLIYCHIPEHL
jgi:hypothetical protein